MSNLNQLLIRAVAIPLPINDVNVEKLLLFERDKTLINVNKVKNSLNIPNERILELRGG